VISLINGSETALLGAALDAATMRQQAIAQNIANANTPGYRKIAVSFESRMGAELAQARPVFTVAAEAKPVAIDVEVAQLSETVLHHQVLLKALNKHYALLATAISEGKR
jgi:flagellar basal-body rod protein FlgB